MLQYKTEAIGIFQTHLTLQVDLNKQEAPFILRSKHHCGLHHFLFNPYLAIHRFLSCILEDPTIDSHITYWYLDHLSIEHLHRTDQTRHHQSNHQLVHHSLHFVDVNMGHTPTPVLYSELN